MEEVDWLSKEAFKNWVKVFTFFDEYVLRGNGVIGGINPDVPIILANTIFQSEIEVDDIDSAIKWVISRYQAENLDFSWSITPFTKPNNFENKLIEYGFSEVGKVPHMGLVNSHVEKDQLESEIKNSNLKIIKVTQDNFAEYMIPFSIGFGISGNQQLYEGFKKFNFEFLQMVPYESPSGLYIGYVDNQPICTSMGYVTDSVMGIYNIATLPEFRRKGYGRIITADLVVRCINANLKGTILQSSVMGKSVYEKLGFTVLYSQKHYQQK